MSDKKAKNSPLTVTKFPRAEFIADFNFLIKTLEEVHPDLYANADLPELQNKYELIRKSLCDEMTTNEFYLVIGKIVPLFKDGHTYIQYGYLLDQKKERYLPFELAFSGKEVVISTDITNTFTINDTIISLNGVPIHKIISEIREYISAEKEIFLIEQLISNFSFLLSIITDIKPPYKVKVKRKGKLLEKEINGAAISEIVAIRQTHLFNMANKVKSLEIKDDQGLLTIGTFGYHGKEGEEFIKFIDAAFKELKSKGIRKLIIDVRNNGGGNSEMAKHIASYLTDKPVYSFRKILWKSSQQMRDFVLDDAENNTHGWYEREAYDKLMSVNLGECYKWDCEENENPVKSKLTFKGKVYVLSNNMTFSTTTDFLAMVRDFGLGTIIGTESGGLPNCYGDSYGFNLPHTNLHVSVSHKFFIRPSGNEKDNDITPDIVISQTDEDRKSNIDTVLEYAKALTL
jgi:C-terminal processing protease CtpA/Prc